MTFFTLTRTGGPFVYQALGFTAVNGAVLDGSASTPAITTAPDAYWAVGGSSESGITRFAQPGYVPGYVEPTDGSALVYNATTNQGEYGSASLSATYARRDVWIESWTRDAFSPPSLNDVPAVTHTLTQTTNLSSPVVVKPAIVGLGSQTLGWNGSTSPTDNNFRYWPGSFKTNNGGSNDAALYGETKPGGGAQSATWPEVMEFTTASTNSVVELYFYADGGGMNLGIEVNGQPIQQGGITSTASGNHLVTLTWQSVRARRIRLYGARGIAEVRIPTGQALTKPTAPTKKIAIIGDSWVNGAGSTDTYPLGASMYDTFAARLVRLMGGPAAHGILAGIGGTGWNAGMDGGTPNPYSSRLSAVLAMSPDVLIFYGSQNDGNVDVGSYVTSALTTAAAVSRIIVVSTMLRGTTAYNTQVNSVRAATLAAGREFIDLRDFINGTGAADAPNGTGNADLFLLSNGNLHMTQAGHRAAAAAVFKAINGVLV